jgi:hypothetical protein
MVIEVGAKVGSGTPVLGTLVSVLLVQLKPMGTLTQVLDDDDVFFLFLQKQKIGSEFHIYLEEGTYQKKFCSVMGT